MRIGSDLSVYVLRTFNGLLICPVLLKHTDYWYTFEFIYIFNPVTVQYKQISQIRQRWYPLDIILTPDHKLIMFSVDRFSFYTHYHQIRMYISDTQSWEIMYTFPLINDVHYPRGIKGLFFGRRGSLGTSS